MDKYSTVTGALTDMVSTVDGFRTSVSLSLSEPCMFLQTDMSARDLHARRTARANKHKKLMHY